MEKYEISKETIERFWKKVQVCKHGMSCKECCWEWIGMLKGDTGYGKMKFPPLDKTIPAHKVSFILNINHHFPLPQGVYVCHDCDNNPCVNFWHLFAGSYETNMKDKYAKNRVGAPGTKFNLQTAQRIRRLYATGKYKISDLKERFNCAHSSISYILRGVTWREAAKDCLQDSINEITRTAVRRR